MINLLKKVTNVENLNNFVNILKRAEKHALTNSLCLDMKNSCIEANGRFTISENCVVQPLLKDLFPFSPQKVEKKVTEYTPSVLKMLSSFTNQKNARWIVVVSTIWKGPLSYFLLFSSGCFYTTIRAEGRKKAGIPATLQSKRTLSYCQRTLAYRKKLIHMPKK